MSVNVPEIYGSMVFNDAVMRARLPKEVYKSLRQTIATGKTIDVSIADTVASAMKDWAIEKGATHYTHWFQPLTPVTAERRFTANSAQIPCAAERRSERKNLLLLSMTKSIIIPEQINSPTRI